MLSKKLFIIRWATSENSSFNVLLFVHCCNFVRSHCLNFYRDVTLYCLGVKYITYDVSEWNEKKIVLITFSHISIAYLIVSFLLCTTFEIGDLGWIFRQNFTGVDCTWEHALSRSNPSIFLILSDRGALKLSRWLANALSQALQLSFDFRRARVKVKVFYITPRRSPPELQERRFRSHVIYWKNKIKKYSIYDEKRKISHLAETDQSSLLFFNLFF